MVCDPGAVVRNYIEPAFYNPQPEWLTCQGMEELMVRSLSARDNVTMTGTDDIAQIVDSDQRALILATQSWDYGWIVRAMATVKAVQARTPPPLDMA
jgi:hypothetical protein